MEIILSQMELRSLEYLGKSASDLGKLQNPGRCGETGVLFQFFAEVTHVTHCSQEVTGTQGEEKQISQTESWPWHSQLIRKGETVVEKTVKQWWNIWSYKSYA